MQFSNLKILPNYYADSFVAIYPYFQAQIIAWPSSFLERNEEYYVSSVYAKDRHCKRNSREWKLIDCIDGYIDIIFSLVWQNLA